MEVGEAVEGGERFQLLFANGGVGCYVWALEPFDVLER